MKIRTYILLQCLFLLCGFIALALSAHRTPDTRLDRVATNEILSELRLHWDTLKDPAQALPGIDQGIDYVILDADEKLLRTTRPGLSENVDAAVTHRDTILAIRGTDETDLGTLIIHNNTTQEWQQYRSEIQMGAVIILIIAAALNLWLLFRTQRRILRPFDILQSFATHVARGDLDLPLPMDQDAVFGAFTESFDILRTELAAARESEQRANLSKKELVASLSHDIKTPIASIKALSEWMMVTVENEKTKTQIETVISKADQIDLLMNNLFQATMEEMQELKVEVAELSSLEVATLMRASDYLHRAGEFVLPECLVLADPIRLSQVFDNILSNSYKYAGTDIRISSTLDDDLVIEISDSGPGVRSEDLLFLTQKYYRGENAREKSGAGLGLYISSFFMQKMQGTLECKTDTGFTVRLSLRLCGHNP